jgi:F-type H+-transporting ATPase subunit a
MNLSPDEIIIYALGAFHLNLTIITTWGIIILLVCIAKCISTRLVSDVRISTWQSFLEILVLGIKQHIEEVGVRHAEKYLSFLGTLFIFLVTANLLSIFPGYRIPTGSLSTTAALALVVFVSVIAFGINEKGIKTYLHDYCKPTMIMLPFNLIGEVSRTIALAIRLFGNMMSGDLIGSILLTITPLFIPMVMNIFGLFIGMVQAYVFTVLSTVYIAAATQAAEASNKGENNG